MRIVALDVGDVLIGVAISDPSEIIAQGLETIRRVGVKKDIETITDLVDQHEVGEIVVGLPKMMSGEIGIQAQKVLDFVEPLRSAVDIPVTMWDERLTTVTANRSLIEANVRRKKRKKVVDKVAAVIILQGYLDSRSSQRQT